MKCKRYVTGCLIINPDGSSELSYDPFEFLVIIMYVEFHRNSAFRKSFTHVPWTDSKLQCWDLWAVRQSFAETLTIYDGIISLSVVAPWRHHMTAIMLIEKKKGSSARNTIEYGLMSKQLLHQLESSEVISASWETGSFTQRLFRRVATYSHLLLYPACMCFKQFI